MKTRLERDIEALCDDLLEKIKELEKTLSNAVPTGSEAICVAIAAADILADSLAQAASSDFAAQRMLFDVTCLLKSKMERFRNILKKQKNEKENNSN